MRRFSFTERQQAARAASNNDRPGELIVKPGSAYLYSPGYDMGPQKDGITVFRVLPHVDPETKQFVPFYDGQDFGDWIRVYTTIRYLGSDPDNQAAFIVADVTDTVNATQHPTAVLRKAIKRALESGTDPGGWHPYINGQKPFIPEAKGMYFVQVVLLHHNKPMDQPKGLSGKPYILMMSPSAGEALCDLFRTEITEATLAQRAGTQDPIQMQFEHGDPVSVYDGRWVVMYKQGNGDPRTRHLAPAANTQPQLFGQQVLQMGGEKDKKALAAERSYACYAEQSFYGLPANFLADPVQQQALIATARPWDELLYRPSIEEQVELLATRFPFAMLEYAFQNRPDWLQIIRRKLGMDAVHMGYGSTTGPTLPPTTAPSAFAGVPAGPAAAPAAFGTPPAQAPMFGAGVAPGMPNVNPVAAPAPAFGGAPVAPAAPVAPPAAPVFGGQLPTAPVAPPAPPASVSPMASPAAFGSGPVTAPPPAAPPAFGGGSDAVNMVAAMAPQPPAGAAPLATNAFAVMQQAAAAQTGQPAAPAAPPAAPTAPPAGPHPGASVFGNLTTDPDDKAPF